MSASLRAPICACMVRPALAAQAPSHFPLTPIGVGAAFDARTFKVMSDMIQIENDVPMFFTPQLEYREQVRRLAKCSSYPP